MINFFDCIFFTMYRWIAFLESKHLSVGADTTIFSTFFYIAFLFSLNLYVIYSGISIWADLSFAVNTLEELIVCMLLTYGFCYLYYFQNKRYIRIIRFKQLNIMQITTTILYVIITVMTFIGILYVERNKL